MNTRLRRGIPALLVALALAGCGGGAERGAGPTTTAGRAGTSTTTSTTSTVPPTTVAPSTEPTTSSPATTTAPPTTAPAPTPSIVLARGNPAVRAVVLTFDAGSDRGNVDRILDTLAAQRVPAAFGLTGVWTRANPDAARRIVALGDTVLNHTDDHRSWTGASTGTSPLSGAQRVAELQGAEASVVAATGRSTRPWFRPPYGDTDDTVRRDAGAAGYRYEVLWTVDSLGWEGLTADAITHRCLDLAVPGAIFLFHVGSASQDAAALPAIIEGLRSRGYTFTTIDDLAAHT